MILIDIQYTQYGTTFQILGTSTIVSDLSRLGMFGSAGDCGVLHSVYRGPGTDYLLSSARYSLSCTQKTSGDLLES